MHIIHKWKIIEHSKANIPIRRRCVKCGKKELNVWGHWVEEK